MKPQQTLTVDGNLGSRRPGELVVSMFVCRLIESWPALFVAVWWHSHNSASRLGSTSGAQSSHCMIGQLPFLLRWLFLSSVDAKVIAKWGERLPEVSTQGTSALPSKAIKIAVSAACASRIEDHKVMSVSHGCRCRILVHQVQFVDIKSSAFKPVLRGPLPARRPNHRINESWTM